MAFIEWIIGLLLNLLLNDAKTAIVTHENKVTEDKQNGVIDDANVAKYNAAKDRAAKIAAAQSLLNRVP